MRRALVLVICGIAIATPAINAQGQTDSIFYTGQLDGFAGSTAHCTAPACGEQFRQAVIAIRDLRARSRGSILIGLGDNFAPEPGTYFDAQEDVHQRLDPDFAADHFRVIEFLHYAGYDAVVPGVQDFYFGAEFVRRSEDAVPMVAANLVRNAMQKSTCPAYPPLPAITILLPDQISSSIASGSSASAASSGSGGSGGGGKGKGGKKGGGGSGSSASSAGGGGAATGAGGGGGGGAAATCLPRSDGEVHTKADPAHPAPKILWPDANSIYPWTTEIGFAAPIPAGTALYLCQPEDPKNAPAHLDSKACTENPLTPDRAPGSGARYQIASGDLGLAQDGSGRILPLTDQSGFKLLAGAAGRICATWAVKSKDEVNHACAAIAVQYPMFNYAWRIAPGAHTVIVGALAPDTLNGLSSMDTAWYEDPHAPLVARQVGVNDPASAIVQVLRAFDLLKPEKEQSYYAVLLAQMPPSEAKALADSLGESAGSTRSASAPTRVNAIFSAADPVEATPHGSVDIQAAGQSRGNSQASYFIPVFTPSPVFQKSDCLSRAENAATCLSRVTREPVVHGEENKEADAGEVQLENHPSTPDPQSAAAGVPQGKAGQWETPFCADQKPQSAAQDWECGVLKRMLEDTSADPGLGNSSDVAILEGKDFDFSRNEWSKNPTAAPDAEKAKQILWKAGRLVRVSLLGSTLQTLLQQNDKLQTRSFQVLASSRPLQQLKVLGIVKIGAVYYINGTPLSLTQVYSVATTDRLANTTSDYSQLAQVDLDNPNLFPAHGRTVQIADIALGLPKGAPKVSLYEASDMEGAEREIVAKKKGPQAAPPSYSYSNRTIPNETLNGAAKKPAGPGTAGAPAKAAADSKLGVPPAEKARQLRPMVRFTLEQASASYSSASPNQSDSSIASNFGGVSNPNVSAAYSSSLSSVQTARFVWYPPTKRKFPLEDMGLDYLLNYTYSVQGSLAMSSSTTPAATTTTGAAVPERVKSLTANNITLSPFFEFQLPQAPQWKALVVRGIVTDNLATPLPQYLAGCTAGSSLTFISNGIPTSVACDANAAKSDCQFSLRKTWTFGQSIGTRFEKDDFRYVEGGFTHQRSHDVLNSVGVVGAGPNNVTLLCSLIGTQSLTLCAGDLPAIANVSLASNYSNYTQYGGYLLGLWTVPLMQRVVFQGSGFGNFFAYGNKNQSVLTHYAFNGMATVLVNLPANFSIGPTLNEFFFQANATHTPGSSLIRRTIGAQLNYSFDWHTGVSLKEFSGNSQ